jgi:hypothetical protein
MRQSAGLLDRLFGKPPRRIREAQKQQIKAHVGERGHAPRLAVEMGPLPLAGGVDRQRELKLRTSLGEGGEMQQARRRWRDPSGGVVEPLR